MMLSEAAHRFAPQFMMPLFEYGVLLLEAFKTAMGEVIGYLFQSLIFPTIEFCYNTIVSLSIFNYLGSIPFLSALFVSSSKNCKEEAELESRRNERANVMYARRNDYMKDDYCGSSFDGSSNSSATDDTSTSQSEKQEYSPDRKRNVNTSTPAQGGDNDDVNEIDDMLNVNQVPTRRNRNKNGNNYSESSASNGYYSNQFRQQIMGTVNEYANQAKQIQTGIQDKWEVTKTGLKEQIERNTPKNITQMTKNVNQQWGYSKNRAINNFTYYKEEYFMYYFELIVEIIQNPMAFVEAVKNYVNQKKEGVVEFYDVIKNSINLKIFLVRDTFDSLCKMLKEMKNGTFNYWLAVWNIAEFVQQSLIRIIHYLGAKNWFARVILFCDVLGKLQQLKSYSKKNGGVKRHHD